MITGRWTALSHIIKVRRTFQDFAMKGRFVHDKNLIKSKLQCFESKIRALVSIYNVTSFICCQYHKMLDNQI